MDDIIERRRKDNPKLIGKTLKRKRDQNIMDIDGEASASEKENSENSIDLSEDERGMSQLSIA